MSILLVESAASLGLSTVFVIFLRWIAVPLRLLDLPDHRKRHEGAIPLCGGLAIFLAFAAICLFAGGAAEIGPGFWLAILLIVGLGAADDRFALPARLRFVAQVLIAAVPVAAEGLGRLSFGTVLPFETVASGVLPAAFAVAFVVGLVNAWNMVDGVDGLAGGSALAALAWILVLAVSAGEGGLVVPVAVLVAAVCGFLAFNLRAPWRTRASVYLGDAGSTALGATIAYLLLRLANGSEGLPFLTLLWLVIVPVVDTLSLMVRRMLDRRSPMAADRRHLHHLLIDGGLTPAATSYTIAGLSFVCGAIGCFGLLLEIADGFMAAGLVLPFAAHTAFVLAVEPETRARLRAFAQRHLIVAGGRDRRRVGRAPDVSL